MFKYSTLIADAITAQSKIVTFKPNSIFAALELVNSEEELNAITAAIANKITNNIALLRNKIIPVMNEFIEVVKIKLAETKIADPYSNYNIIELSVPEVVDELRDAKILLTKRQAKELPIAAISIPTPKIEDIKGYFKHSINSINIYIKSIIDKYTNDDLILIWEKYLSNVSKTNNNIASIVYSPELKLNELIALYTVVNNIKEEKPVTVPIEDNNYKNIMTMFMHEILNAIAIAVNNIEMYKNTSKLVLDINSNNSGITITVLKELYSTYISEGYSVDSLFGLIQVEKDFSDYSIYTINSIRVKADIYAQEWNKRIKLDKIARIPADIERQKVVYILTLNTLYDHIIPGDLTEYLAYDKINANRKLEEYFKTIPGSELYNIDEISRYILSNIVFAKTNFKEFTAAMYEYMKLHPGMDANEAASVAVLDLVMYYLLEQVELVTGRIN
jgi:hypothetical protein